MKNLRNKIAPAPFAANPQQYKAEFAEQNAAVKKKNTAAEPSENTTK